jgi:hypothetical protein
MLAAMFSERYKVDKDKDGNYFLDMDGTRFKHILNYLRNEQHLPPRNIAQEVITDAMYLGINSLVDRIKPSLSLSTLYLSLNMAANMESSYFRNVESRVVKK